MSGLIDNKDDRRFELQENGLTVFVDYQLQDALYILPHVEADPALRGTGAAGRLMAAIADHARTHGFLIAPRCSYARAWFRRYPENADMVA